VQLNHVFLHDELDLDLIEGNHARVLQHGLADGVRVVVLEEHGEDRVDRGTERKGGYGGLDGVSTTVSPRGCVRGSVRTSRSSMRPSLFRSNIPSRGVRPG